MKLWKAAVLELGTLMLAGVSSAQTSKQSIISVSQLGKHLRSEWSARFGEAWRTATSWRYVP